MAGTLVQSTIAADNSNADVVNIDIDENGVFTIEALQTGESWVWLTAEGEYEMHIIVQ